MKRNLKGVQLIGDVENEISRKKIAKGVLQNAIKIGNKMIAWVPVELLVVKPYQRNRQKHVIQIAETWDDSKCNVLLVSYDSQTGYFSVVDGQHRALAAKMRGIEYLVCEIFENMTISEEATLFVDGNSGSKRLNPFDVFRANQYRTGADETELSIIDKRIKKICDEYDIKVERSNACGCLKSVTEARSIIKKSGEVGMKYVLDIVQESRWNNFTEGYSGDLMSALGKVYSRTNGSRSTKDKLVRFFRKSNPTELIALGNNAYPNLGRRARLDAIIIDIIADPDNSTKGKMKAA